VSAQHKIPVQQLKKAPIKDYKSCCPVQQRLMIQENFAAAMFMQDVAYAQ
jgi:hypothetical protein